MKLFNNIITAAKKDKDILAVSIFGSYARGEKSRDIDVCLFLTSKLNKVTASKKRMFYMSHFPNLDVHVFQQLPLYIRSRVLKEGKIKLCKNQDILFDIAYTTIKEFEDFKPRYEMIIGA